MEVARQAIDAADWELLRSVAVRKPAACLTVLQQAQVLEPDSPLHQPQPLQLFASICLRFGSHADAGWGLYYAARLLGGAQHLPLPMQNALLRNHPLWHQDVKGDRVVLARPREHHAPALVEMLGDAEFRAKYNAFLPAPEAAAREYIERVGRPVEAARQINWVVQSPSGEVAGLATLAALDFVNRRAELVFGFRGDAADGRARMEAFQLVLMLTFQELRLAKLCSMVYATNPEAQDMTLRMGLTQEGYLRRHLVVPGHPEGVDVYLNGLLLSDFHTDPRIQQHSRLAFRRTDPTRLFDHRR
ncbi:GNAT family N-acetyltransferase [Ramlibacter sp. MAHUQ-53]|uniref:GNAT family N-acetyltransferase n=1 Tax=unclassified Ramlibacter TaxID=2617605 RepID=UPI003634AFC7